MVCVCGRLHPGATVKTPGRCVECGRSVWLQEAARHRPDSRAIAAALNVRQADTCACSGEWHTYRDVPHYRGLGLFPVRIRRVKTACFAICGVLLERGQWQAITENRRASWFEKLIPGYCSEA